MRATYRAWAPFTNPVQLEILPWKTAEPLALDCAGLYGDTEEWGLLLVLGILCRKGLVWLASQYPRSTPAEILLLFRDGIMEGTVPWGHARQQLYEEVRTEQGRAEILDKVTEDPTTPTKTEPGPLAEVMDLRTAWPLLTDEEREVIDLSMQGYEGAELAALLGVSVDVSKQRLFRARSRLKELIGGI